MYDSRNAPVFSVYRRTTKAYDNNDNDDDDALATDV